MGIRGKLTPDTDLGIKESRARNTCFGDCDRLRTSLKRLSIHFGTRCWIFGVDILPVTDKRELFIGICKWVEINQRCMGISHMRPHSAPPLEERSDFNEKILLMSLLSPGLRPGLFG